MIVTDAKIIARHSTPAYQRRMTDEGKTHHEKERTRVTCPMCEVTIQEQHLPDHIRYIHSRRWDDTAQNDDEEEEKEGEADEAEIEEEEQEEVTYTMSMEHRDGTGACPKCSTLIRERYGMLRHFMHRHLNDKIIIEEEGELPRCPSCGMFGRINQAHQRSKTYKEGTIRKDQRDIIREQYQARRVKFKIGVEMIETVQDF
jgi:uncharacterized C2H2 Zn-finger protein